MGLNLVSTFYLWVFCNQLFHQPLFLYFATLGIEIWFRQRKCWFVEKKLFASFAILFEISRRHWDRFCRKFNIVRSLPNSAEWFNSYVKGRSMLKIADIFPLTFLQLEMVVKAKSWIDLWISVSCAFSLFWFWNTLERFSFLFTSYSYSLV